MYANIDALPDHIKTAMPASAAQLFIDIYNTYEKHGVSAEWCMYYAWDSLWCGGYSRKADGSWEAREMPIAKRQQLRMFIEKLGTSGNVQGTKAVGKRHNDGSWEIEIPIAKADADKMWVFGWASIIIDEKGKQVIDLEGDVIEVDELEQAVYDYVKYSRVGGEMHEKYAGILIESMMFTAEKMKALGIEEGVLPIGWWVGYHIEDADVWAKIKSGEYKAFSIGGSAKRVETEV